MKRRRMEVGNGNTDSEEGGKSVDDVKEIILTQTAYKIYTAILVEKLKEEVEGKDVLSPSQVGFRKGIGIISMF